MFWDSIFDLAFMITKIKYSNEFKNPYLLFKVIEMVADDLAVRNGELFITPYTNQLADVSKGTVF